MLLFFFFFQEDLKRLWIKLNSGFLLLFFHKSPISWWSYLSCTLIVNHIRGSLCLQHCFPNDVSPDVTFCSLGKMGWERVWICLVSRKHWLVPPCHCADERLLLQKSASSKTSELKCWKAESHSFFKSFWTSVVFHALTIPMTSTHFFKTTKPLKFKTTQADNYSFVRTQNL